MLALSSGEVGGGKIALNTAVRWASASDCLREGGRWVGGERRGVAPLFAAVVASVPAVGLGWIRSGVVGGGLLGLELWSCCRACSSPPSADGCDWMLGGRSVLLRLAGGSSCVFAGLGESLALSRAGCPRRCCWLLT
jgi:hypothetical protein